MTLDEIDKLIYEIKQEIKFVEKYISDMKNDNLMWDTLTLEHSLENLEANINQLYVLTNPYYLD